MQKKKKGARIYKRKFGLKYTDFKKYTEQGKEFSTYLLVGEDGYFRERGLALLKKTFLAEPSLNLANFNGDTEINEIVGSLNSYPFLSKKRFTVVREFYPKQEVLKGGLKEYLSAPVGQSVLVIINQKSHDAFKKFDCICEVDCGKADISLLTRWIQTEANKYNVNIASQTAGQLAEFCLSDMSRIEKETKKLIDYVGAGNQITEEELKLLVPKENEFKIYEMTDYISRKQFDLALSVIDDMTSKGESSQRILTAVYNYYRRLLHSAISGKTHTELAKSFGIKEYPAKKLKEQSAKFKKRSLKSAVDLLEETDYRIKSGLIEPDKAMWLTIFKIMTDN